MSDVIVDVVDGEVVDVLIGSPAAPVEIEVGAEVGDRGPQGDPGPANTLAIGTVTGGETAAATITGVAPSQTLNLTLPKGDTGAAGPAGQTGPAGPANTLSIGTVTTGAAGSAASATITGTPPSQTLSLTIPRGDVGATGATGDNGRDIELQATATHLQWRNVGDTAWINLVPLTAITGPTGPANTLAIGTVSSGTTPSATITGTAPNQTLNLVLPKGDTGSQGPAGPAGGLTFGLLVAFS